MILNPHGYADGSYYVGQTGDLARRVAQHHAGGNCTYTTPRRPLRLVWSQELASAEEATARELQIKAWSRRKKEALISGDVLKLQAAAKKVWSK